MDVPDHSRVRKMIAGAFTARRVERLRPRVEEHVERLITAMIEAGPSADLMPAFAAPLPVTVICELLGIPFEDRVEFGRWSRAFLATTSSEYTQEEVVTAQRSLVQYLAQLLVAKAENPGDDLLSALAVRNAEEQTVSQAELTFLGVTLLVAGHETTVNMITNGLLALLTHPDQLELLKAEPALAESAVEEILRVFVPGNEALLRIATEDVDLGGVTVPAGCAVLPSLLSANRDERTFTDSSRFDITRREGQHLTFGSGPHFCIGSSLARIELAESFRELLRRLPGLALVDLNEVERPEGLLVNGVAKLPITWDDAAARAQLAAERGAEGGQVTGEA
ncbi:cytochrome P450 [Rhodococcus rhodnii]|uniref:Cytochrome P450 CYP105 n=3 Tax=Rhodococcus rhodnii TaxID=38312 RepID=R7WMP9_9NOCA|nr:cytochrome P450 [Rhodococcus rhodnii]EOM76582.1 cytochrome P450 CYP105 [Rhodococcus rhodnii LMG 5362]TXG92186.1 cytochrome P450 [Rhodococcus rhodnii]